jgi:hypothetical protein
MNLLSGGRDGFCALFRKLLDNLNASLKGINGAAPWVEVFQRRYPAQKSEPIIDARVQFDLRTAFEEHKGIRNSVKQQQQWLEATYDALAQKTSNLQLGVGAIFRYERCPDVHEAEILNHVANVWLGCKPLIETLIGAGAGSVQLKSISNQWRNIREDIRKDLLARGLKEPRLRLNALDHLEHLLNEIWPDFLNNPKVLLEIGKEDASARLAQLKKFGTLNGAEKSILNEIFARLVQGPTNSTSSRKP